MAEKKAAPVTTVKSEVETLIDNLVAKAQVALKEFLELDQEKIDALKALGFHDFDFYQTLLRNPMYTNEVVEDVVPGYQSGGYVAIIAHK